jgi:hypothetical protein
MPWPVHAAVGDFVVRRMHAYDSPEGRANVAAIESKLAELDGVFRTFCAREGYTFSPIVQLWPRRRVWRRQEIDRCMDLTMEEGVQDVLDRGYDPQLQWSLWACGSLPRSADPDIRILSRPVFEHVPFSHLSSALGDGLERGLRLLNDMTGDEIKAHGQKFRGAEPSSPANGSQPSCPDSNRTSAAAGSRR